MKPVKNTIQPITPPDKPIPKSLQKQWKADTTTFARRAVSAILGMKTTSEYESDTDSEDTRTFPSPSTTTLDNR